jgi:hypothetical protein
LSEVIEEIFDVISSIIDSVEKLVAAVFGLIFLVVVLWASSLALTPVLNMTPIGGPVSVALTFQDGLDIAAAIVAIASVVGTWITKNHYVLLLITLSGVLIAFSFGL